MKKLLLLFAILLLASCTQQGSFGGDLIETKEDKIAKIENKVKIGEIEKDIWFDDESLGEDFIIRTDEKDYVGFGGSNIVYFSVTNISDKKQGSKILFSFLEKGHLNYVKRFERNEESNTILKIPDISNIGEDGQPVVTEIATTTSVAIYTDMLVDGNEIDKSKFKTKDVKGRKQDKWFHDIFEIGETKYYKASIKIPLGTDGEEWFIEVIGTLNGYGHL